MEIYRFLRVYAGYGLVYVSYKASLSILDKLFSMVDERIDTDPNVLSDSTDGVITTHDYETGKKIVDIISVRGGKGDIILRGATGLSKVWKHSQRFGDKLISNIIKPTADTIEYLLVKFPVLKNIYDVLKHAKIIIASTLALGAIRLVARFDYWSLIICGALPKTDLSDEVVLTSIRMGIKDIAICMPGAEKILDFVTDEEIDLTRKSDKLIKLFTTYESLSETYFFKNPLKMI